MVTQSDMPEIAAMRKRSGSGSLGGVPEQQQPLQGGMFGQQEQASTQPLPSGLSQAPASGGGMMDKLKKLASMFGGGMGMGG